MTYYLLNPGQDQMADQTTAGQPQDQQVAQDQPLQLPVLRIAPTPPVQITLPQRAAAAGGGGGGLNDAALGKKIAGLLQQKYGGAPIDNLGTLGDEPLIQSMNLGG